ncbi:unnamed protein product, partial [Allacma fusca]
IWNLDIVIILVVAGNLYREYPIESESLVPTINKNGTSVDVFIEYSDTTGLYQQPGVNCLGEFDRMETESVEQMSVEMETEISVLNSCKTNDQSEKDQFEGSNGRAEVEVLEDGNVVDKSSSVEKGPVLETKDGGHKLPEPPRFNESTAEGVPPEGQQAVCKENAALIKYLVSQAAKNCEVVEAAALDFVADELHHPVISCLREIKKADFDTIFNQTRFKTEISVLEQGITCIALMDYIATSLGNPLYSEYFTKNEYSIRPKIKKIFTELRRILKDWAEKDPDTFGTGKGMIIKFLGGLTPYFKSIEYDKNFAAALIVLEKDAARAQRKQKVTTGNSSNRSALLELVENNCIDSDKLNDPAEEDSECELKQDFFDFLDDIPRKAKTAPIFLKKFNNKKSSYFKTKSSFANSASKNTLQTVSKSKEPDLDIQVIDQGMKRPASTDIDSGVVKKVCLDVSHNTGDMIRSEKDQINQCSSTSLSTIISCGKIDVPAKEKVNAFVFLMNRSKELAKASKLKQQTKTNSLPLKKTPVGHTLS